MSQLLITDARKFGPFLQIAGHISSETFREFNACILKLVTQVKNPATLEAQSRVDTDCTYLVPNTRTNDISRFKVIKERDNGKVLGKFIDYGYDTEVPKEHVRILFF